MFRILVLEVEKLQHKWIFDFFIGRDQIAWLCFLTFAEHGGFVLGQ